MAKAHVVREESGVVMEIKKKLYTLKKPIPIRPQKEPDLLGDVINNSGLREMLSKSIEQNLMTKIKSGQMLCKDCGKVTTEGRLIHEVVSGDDEFSERVIVYIQCFDCARKEIDGRITE